MKTPYESIDFGKLDNLNERYQEVAALLSDAETIADQNKFESIKEYAELEPVVKLI